VIGDRPAGVQVQCTDKPTVSCPKGIDAKFALTVAGKARIRVSSRKAEMRQTMEGDPSP
jgi:hypothetical protein